MGLDRPLCSPGHRYQADRHYPVFALGWLYMERKGWKLQKTSRPSIFMVSARTGALLLHFL